MCWEKSGAYFYSYRRWQASLERFIDLVFGCFGKKLIGYSQLYTLHENKQVRKKNFIKSAYVKSPYQAYVYNTEVTIFRCKCTFEVVSIQDGVFSELSPFGIVFIQDRIHSGLCPFEIVSILDGVHSGSC